MPSHIIILVTFRAKVDDESVVNMERVFRAPKPTIQPVTTKRAHEELISKGWAVMETSLCFSKDQGKLNREWQRHLRLALLSDPLVTGSFAERWDSFRRHPTLQADDAPLICMPTLTYGKTMNAIRGVAAQYIEPLLQTMWKGYVMQEVGLPPYDSRWKQRGYSDSDTIPERFITDASVFAWWNLSEEAIIVISERKSAIDVIIEPGELFICLVDPEDPTTKPLSLFGSSGSRLPMNIFPTFAWRVHKDTNVCSLRLRRPLRLRLWPDGRPPKSELEAEWLDMYEELPSDSPIFDPDTGSVTPYFQFAESAVLCDTEMESWVLCSSTP